MRLFNMPLSNVNQTVDAMYALIEATAKDMAPYAAVPLTQIFDKIRFLPYTPDPKGNEFLHRPQATMNEWNGETGLDCDDKTIAVAAWAQLNAYPWKIEIVGRQKKYHHVRLLLLLYGDWYVVDPTYARNTIFRDNFTYKTRATPARGIYYHRMKRLLSSVKD